MGRGNAVFLEFDAEEICVELGVRLRDYDRIYYYYPISLAGEVTVHVWSTGRELRIHVLAKKVDRVTKGKVEKLRRMRFDRDCLGDHLKWVTSDRRK